MNNPNEKLDIIEDVYKKLFLLFAKECPMTKIIFEKVKEPELQYRTFKIILGEDLSNEHQIGIMLTKVLPSEIEINGGAYELEKNIYENVCGWGFRYEDRVAKDKNFPKEFIYKPIWEALNSIFDEIQKVKNKEKDNIKFVWNDNSDSFRPSDGGDAVL